ncbi:S8 family serine peptidase [Bacillus sp. ISL-41]|uniref:S8 family serine peptidase n=1 Tax=Bacillus sp. ISL-41 TaxID=2819127 RepID=UPI001BE99F18|nr:S8 family serine peptidase [Bacillus sp. ISL-41]MBT2643594.1 S8 family serine peptidase [Bacillus sp. ISL-41]
MKNLKKGLATFGVSASLIASSTLVPTGAAFSQTDASSHVGISAVSVNHPLLQKKLDEQKSPFSEDTLVVKYQKPLSATEHQRLGGTLVRQVSGLNYAIVKVKDKKNLHKVIGNYQKAGKVTSVSPSVLYRQLGIKDPKVGEQYHQAMLQLEKAQKLAGKNKVKVAVIDTGIDRNHPDLKGKILSSVNTVNPISPGVADSHGTHVSGIIAAKKDNGIGGHGVNPDADILSIDVFDRGWGASDYAIAEGILEAVKGGAKVINMSLGGPMPSPVIEEAVKYALEKNVVVVAAAGNSADDWKNYPAGYEGVISVGSVNKDKKLSYYSSFGPSVDIVAPGEEVYSTIYEPEKLSSFRKMSGTSMASPVVAGAASLLLSKYPYLTPAQVEYILEHSADDLGEKGFDVKFGNGLLNPVKALEFDIKKVPSFVKREQTDQQILRNSKMIAVTKPVEINEALTKPFEEKWVKFSVKKGDNIQAILEGTPVNDYKMMIRFIAGGETLLSEDVNKVGEGKAEAKLVEAPANGMLLIGVKDVNGNYDDSSVKLSQYSLVIDRKAAAPEDESSLENPIAIESIPYDGSESPLTFTGNEGDDDYFTFSVAERQVVKLDVSAVPGVNSAISVYPLEMLMPMPGEEMPGEEDPDQGKYSAAHEGHEEEIDPWHYSNFGGISEGETLTFQAEPGMAYAVKVSNKPSNYYGMYEYYYGFDMFMESSDPESSMVPYTFNISGKVMPADEDNLPYPEEMYYPEEPIEEGEAEGTIESQRNLFKQAAAVQKEGSVKVAHDDGEQEFINMILENAREYKTDGKGKGYLSSFEDEDFFKMTPKETGVYEFNFDEQGNIPWFEIYKIEVEEMEDGQEVTWLNYVGTNMAWDMMGETLNPKVYTGLEKGEQYLIRIGNDYMRNQISFDEYSFTSKLLTTAAEDKYEDNDKLEDVKNIPGSVVVGNFGMPNDQDVFYLESKADQVYGVTLENGKLTKDLKNLPKEIVSPFYGFIQVVEDKNKNRKLDEEEYSLVQYIEKGVVNGYTFGSFKAKKDSNYIIVAAGWPDSSTPLTLMPYKLTVAAVNAKDEDAGNKVTNNIASKPIEMKRMTADMWESTGHFNSGHAFGDEDWYTFTVGRTVSGVIKLETSFESDGKIELYQNGKLIHSADYYAEGDAEVMPVTLKRGTYQVKITDFHGGSTLQPYKLKVYVK